MDALYAILPDAIIYLASGFAFIAGFYSLIDKRFDFFSEIGFTVMLALGFVCTNLLQILPKPFVITDSNVRGVLIVIASGCLGLLTALIRNVFGKRASLFIIKYGRRRTSSKLFWYYLLDEKDKPVWLRLRNDEGNYILEGVLLSLDEADENPYLLLGYCRRLDLDGALAADDCASKSNVQYVVRADSFNEIQIIYDEKSSKCVDLKIIED